MISPHCDCHSKVSNMTRYHFEKRKQNNMNIEKRKRELEIEIDRLNNEQMGLKILN